MAVKRIPKGGAFAEDWIAKEYAIRAGFYVRDTGTVYWAERVDQPDTFRLVKRGEYWYWEREQ